MAVRDQAGLLSWIFWLASSPSCAVRPEPFWQTEVRSLSIFEESLAADPIVTAESCGDRVCLAAGLGEFYFKAPEGFFLPHKDTYTAHVGNALGSCKDPSASASLPVEAVTPWVDPADPVHNSSIFVYVDPVLLAHHPAKEGLICAGTGLCLCHASLTSPRWSVEFLRWPLARMTATGAEMRLLQMQDWCRPAGLLDILAIFVLLSGAMLIFLLLHAGHIAMWVVQLVRELLGGGTQDAGAIAVPSVAGDLKDGAMQTLRLTTLMMSLQWTILERIKKDAPMMVMSFVELWPLAFGIFGILRSLHSMCQRQLAHAALAHGCCLTGATRLAMYDGVTSVGMVILAICVVLSLASYKLYAVCGLVVALFMGPTLSILGELQKAREADDFTTKMKGVYLMPQLLQMFQKSRGSERANDDDTAPRRVPLLEERLLSGDVRMVPLSALVSAGRASGDMVATLKLEDLPQRDAEFSLLRDFSWHGAAVLKLTGSRAGFLTLPILVLAILAMLLSAFFQATRLLCDVPELSYVGLSFPEDGIHFRPWIHRYQVGMDSSFKRSFVVASAEESNTTSLSIGEKVSGSNSSAFGTVELSDKPLPHQIKVRKCGLQSKSMEYGIAFTPVTTLASHIIIRGPNFTRNLPWGDIPGAVISLPSHTKTNLSLSIDIVLTDFEFGVPQSCEYRHSIAAARILAAYCPKGTSCQEQCRHKPHCLAASAGHHGCFEAHSTKSGLLAVRQGIVSDVKSRKWLNRAVSGKVCRLAGADDCIETAPNTNHVLEFRDLLPDWLDKRVDLKVALALAEGDQSLYSNSESLQLKLGSPDVLQVLVNLTGTAHNGSVLHFNATATAEESQVVVTLKEYPPYAIANLTLYLAILLSDPDYTTVWQSGSELADPREVSFQQCERSPLLRHRFNLCRNTSNSDGWNASAVKIVLHSWEPTKTSARFEIKPLEVVGASGVQRAVKLALDGVDSVGAWAVPEQADDSDQCRFISGPPYSDPSPSPPSLPMNVSYLRGHMEKMMADGQKPLLAAAATGAACKLLHRGCDTVSSAAFPLSNVSELVCQVASTFLEFEILVLNQELQRKGLVARSSEELREAYDIVWQGSTLVWHLLRCLSDVERAPRLACQPCPAFREIVAWDVVCCTIAGTSNSCGSSFGHNSDENDIVPMPLAARHLVGILHHWSSEAAEEWMESACSVLLSDRSDQCDNEIRKYCYDHEAIEEKFFKAALSSSDQNVLAVTLRHCVPTSTLSRSRVLWGLSETGVDVMGMVWNQVPQHLSSLLQVALDDRCEHCFDAWRSAVPPHTRCGNLIGQKRLGLSFYLSAGFPPYQLHEETTAYSPELASICYFLSAAITTPCVTPLLTQIHLALPRWELQRLPRDLQTGILQLMSAVSSSLAELKVENLRLGFSSSAEDEQFLESLGNLGQLRKLRLQQCSCTPSHLERLLGFPNMLHLEALSLDLVDAADDGTFMPGDAGPDLGPVVNWLQHFSLDKNRCMLEELFLENYRTNESQVPELLDALRYCHGLRSVNLCSSNKNRKHWSNSTLQALGARLGRAQLSNLTSFVVPRPREKFDDYCTDLLQPGSSPENPTSSESGFGRQETWPRSKA